MSQVFPPASNTIARLSLLVIVLMLACLAGSVYLFVRSPYITGVGQAKAQPVAFSHKQHVGGLGLDCRYCHSSVAETNFAGIPPTETCMGCHAHVAAEAATLAIVRESYEDNQPLEWIRVNDLPDFVYFDHSVHVQKGIGCETCHGRVDQMPVIAKTETLQMDWCLACHRAPDHLIRPNDEVFTMGWEAPGDRTLLGKQLVLDQDIKVNHLTDCSICHR